MSFKRINLFAICFLLHIITQLPCEVNAFFPVEPKENSCGQTVREDCGTCAEGFECVGSEGIFGPQCGTCQEPGGKHLHFYSNFRVVLRSSK